jgi:hypothetical protein
MVFNASKNLSEEVLSEPWSLFGEPVKVSKTYKYLGADICNNLGDWSTYFNRAISKAKNISDDLAWVCRHDTGLLPRTAATLWKAIVRPVLEYLAELWAGDINSELTKRAESVQTNFARCILGLQGCQSIPDDFLRAELGLEKLTSRWHKLRLGYWRRLHMTATPGTTLNSLVSLRRWQVDWAPAAFDNGWMGKSKSLLHEGGLSKDWYNPSLCCASSKQAWKTTVYDSVEKRETKAMITRLTNMSSDHAARFARSKCWSKVNIDFACFSGEVGRRGALVTESYLDDREEPIGTRLKLMCRAGCLPVLKRVAREAQLPEVMGICKMCTSGNIETIEHLVMDCTAHSRPRSKLMSLASFGPDCTSSADKLDVLLGKSTGLSKTDDIIDMAVKRFLKKAWRSRKWLVLETNRIFSRDDTPWASAHGDGLNASFNSKCRGARAA